MTVTIFLSLLAAFSTATGLITEAIKKILADSKKGCCATLVAAIVGLCVGIGGTAAYYCITATPFTASNVVFMILMGIASVLTATLGYDKIRLAIAGCKIPEE